MVFSHGRKQARGLCIHASISTRLYVTCRRRGKLFTADPSKVPKGGVDAVSPWKDAIFPMELGTIRIPLHPKHCHAGLLDVLHMLEAGDIPRSAVFVAADSLGFFRDWSIENIVLGLKAMDNGGLPGDDHPGAGGPDAMSKTVIQRLDALQLEVSDGTKQICIALLPRYQDALSFLLLFLIVALCWTLPPSTCIHSLVLVVSLWLGLSG